MFIKKYNEIENPVVLNKDLNNTVPRPPKNSLKILPQLLQNQEKVVNPKQIFDFHNYNQVINSPSNKMSDFHPSPSINNKKNKIRSIKAHYQAASENESGYEKFFNRRNSSKDLKQNYAGYQLPSEPIHGGKGQLSRESTEAKHKGKLGTLSDFGSESKNEFYKNNFDDKF